MVSCEAAGSLGSEREERKMGTEGERGGRQRKKICVPLSLPAHASRMRVGMSVILFLKGRMFYHPGS